MFSARLGLSAVSGLRKPVAAAGLPEAIARMVVKTPTVPSTGALTAPPRKLCVASLARRRRVRCSRASSRRARAAQEGGSPVQSLVSCRRPRRSSLGLSRHMALSRRRRAAREASQGTETLRMRAAVTRRLRPSTEGGILMSSSA